MIDILNKRILIQQSSLACQVGLGRLLQRDLYTMGNSGEIPDFKNLGVPHSIPPLFHSQSVKEFLLKAPVKHLGFRPYQLFYDPHNQEAPTGNTPMGSIHSKQ